MPLSCAKRVLHALSITGIATERLKEFAQNQASAVALRLETFMEWKEIVDMAL